MTEFWTREFIEELQKVNKISNKMLSIEHLGILHVCGMCTIDLVIGAPALIRNPAEM